MSAAQPHRPVPDRAVSPAPRFAGRAALVTGAANGIGAAVVAQLVSEGAHVTGLDLDERGLDRVASLSASGPGTFRGIPVDITETARYPDLIAEAADAGTLDVLVNNAGVFLMGGVDATDYQWSRTLDVNVLAPAKLTAAAVEALSRSEHAAVVNVASISGHVGQPGRWTYNAGKGATLSLTRCQALDLAPSRIRVNSVSPGYVWTDVLEKSAGGDREKWDPIWGSSCPMLRCGEPSEVATAIAFLASDDASYITGTDLLVDGGSLSMAPDALANYEFGE